MASGTPQQRLLALSNMFAQSLESSYSGAQQGTNKDSTVTPVTMTGDTIFTNELTYTADNRAKLLTQKQILMIASVANQRYRTAHG